jgi:diguanylate cyclase (GGDEF)-like protein
MHPGRTKARVLIVEDSLTQSKKLELVLQSVGFEVTVARDGRRGIEAFRGAPFDLVLSDVMMPGVSGYDLCRAIKQSPQGKTVPVILLTSLSKPLDIIRGLECGADNFVNKPYDGDYLISRIRGLLANRNLRAGDSASGNGNGNGDGDADGHGAVVMAFMGERFTITCGKAQILDFLASTFEDFVRAKQREYESILVRQKQSLEAEAQRIREDLLLRERESLRESRQFLQSTLDALSTQIAILDETGKIIAVNAAWGRQDGGNPLVGAGCGEGSNYLDACRAALGTGVEEATTIATGIGAVFLNVRDEFSLEYSCHEGAERRWYSVCATRFAGLGMIPVRVVVAHEDITQRKLAEEQLLHDAFHDALTDLPNRALFMDRLRRAILRTRRQESYHFAVLFLDLDGFKVINDSLGHAAGDQLLIAIGRRLELGMRGGDTLTRLGGDEFAILADDIRDVDDAIGLAERVRGDLKAPFNINGHEVFATGSIGIALGTRDREQPEDLLRDADTAMYHAKALGKERHVVFDQAMHTRVVERLRLETDLRRALERREFEVHYQPIIALRTNEIAGFEALVRWVHPERGSISPASFIPVAEETGLILPLGLWVLGAACRQLREWHDRGPEWSGLMMSVNLSSKQLAQSDLVERIGQILEETGLDPQHLKLEITESVIMEHPHSAAEVLRRLKDRGIRLSLDDFGTGYSSLSYLHRFPMDTLKVDRSFVNRIDVEDGDPVIVQTIVALAHNLGMQVIAEGVETAGQLERLKAMGCQYGQGYYFSRPVDGESAGALLEARPAIASLA